MLRVFALLSCAITVTALFALVPSFSEQTSNSEKVAATAAKGKIHDKKGHYVGAPDGKTFTVYLHVDDMTEKDQVDPKDVTANETSTHTFTCVFSKIVKDPDSSTFYLQAEFRVDRKKNALRTRGSGDLTITLFTGSGPSQSQKIQVIGL